MAAEGPDREAFLKRFEGQQQNRTDENTDDGDKREDPLSAVLGRLGGIPVDQSSMRALKDIMEPSHRESDEETDEKDLQAARSISPQLLENPEAQPSAFSQALGPVPNGTMTTASRSSQLPQIGSYDKGEKKKSSTSAPPIERPPTHDGPATNEAIMAQLQYQTNLMIAMEKRINELTDAVQELRQQGKGQPEQQQQQEGGGRGFASQFFAAPARRELQQRVVVRPAVRPQPEAVVPPQAVPVARGVPHVAPVEPQVTWYQQLMELPGRVRSSRTAEVCRVFYELAKRRIRFDLGRMFQVVFMVGLLSAKMFRKRNRRRSSSPWWDDPNTKFYFVAFMLAVGFLVKSGLMEFAYEFFVKENYPRRIFAGEDIDVNNPRAPPQPPRQPRQALANQNRDLPAGEQLQQQEPVGNTGEQQPEPQQQQPQGNFLRGNMARRQRNAGPRGIGGIVMDVFYLFGSFFLSILPIWKLEPIGDPEPPEEDVAPELRDEPNNDGGLPRVQQPRDLDELALDDDEE